MVFADKDVICGLQRANIIGIFVVLLSVPLALAGGMVMQQINRRARTLLGYYAVVESFEPSPSGLPKNGLPENGPPSSPDR